MRKFLLNKNLRKIFFIVLWIAIWEVGAVIVGNDLLLPFPLMVFKETINIMFSEKFIVIVLSTLVRASISFFISLIIAVLLGCLCGFNELINDFIRPVISIIKSVPTMAFIIVALIWFDKEKAPFLIGIIISFPIIFENTIKSIKNIDGDLLFISDVYNVSRMSKIIYMYIPNVLYSIASILNSTICLVFKVVVAGEVYGQPKYGIGAQIQLEKTFLNTSAIFAWIMISAIICALFSLIDLVIRRILYKWKR